MGETHTVNVCPQMGDNKELYGSAHKKTDACN